MPENARRGYSYKLVLGGVKIGCCGFPVARDKYYEHFRSVELQSTFYEPPESGLVKKWRAEAPDGFEFTLKAWQLITHPPSSPTYGKLKTPLQPSKEHCYGYFRPTVEVYWAWERTRELAVALEAKIVVFQSPPGFVPSAGNKRNMEHFFASIERRRVVLGWQPGAEWDESEVRAICAELDLIHVVDPFKGRAATSGLRYYCLGGRKGYKYKYSDRDLETLKKLADKYPNSYFMFSNASMFDDAKRLQDLFEKGESA